MAPWSLKTVAKRLMGEEEQRVVPVHERSTERRKRTSETNLLATMGQEAPADLLRKLRGQRLSQEALDEKLLEVIIKLDALGASGEDVVGWESNIEGMDLDHERRSVLAERAPPSRDMATSPTAPADDASTSSSRTSSFERRASFEDLDAARVKHLMTRRVSPLSRPPAPAPETIADPLEALARSSASRAKDARRRSRASRSDVGSSMGSRPSTAEREPGDHLPRVPRRSVGEEEDEFNASLWDAAALGRIDLVDQALKHLSVDAPDYDTRTALHYAAAEGYANVCEHLLKKGAESSPLDRYGNTPLGVALRNQRDDVVQVLRKHGAKVGDTQLSMPQSSQRHQQLLVAAASGSLADCRTLVAAGVRCDLGDCDKRTALHLAAKHGHLDVVTWLVDSAGADATSQDRWGNSALDDAVRFSQRECSEFLERRGARLRGSLTEWVAPSLSKSVDKARKRGERMVGSWDDTDVLALEKASEGHSLLILGEAIIGRDSGVDTTSLRNFLLRIEGDYGDNPYHGSFHGADVLLTTHNFLATQNLLRHLTAVDLLAGYVAAAVHDYAHPGTNNAHERVASSELAIRYSDDTILERHHCAAAFSVLREPRFDVFSHLTTDERKQARALVIELILMTDLARHGEFIARRLKPLLPRGFKASKENFVSPFHDQDPPFLLTVAVKFADIGHVTKPFELHRQWTQRATEEFWRLGDKEKALGMSVSPLCDREKDTDIARSQIGFFKFVCLPFYKPVFDLLNPEMAPAINCRDNFWRWLNQKDAREKDSNGGNRSPPPLVRAPTTLAAPPRLKRRASVAVSTMSLMRRLSGGRPPRPTALAS
jgi:cAMP-specific phosphodiesterase 4